MFTYQLNLEDGTPADPPTFSSATPTWRAGDEIFLKPQLRYRVLAVDPHPEHQGTLTVERRV